MFASRLLHPDAAGRITENGNRIGQFTVGGTVALIIFGGLLSGLAAAVVWIVVKQWIPNQPLVVGLGAVAIGGFNVVEAGNPDFIIVGDPAVDIALLLGLVFLFGVSLTYIDRWLEGRLPAAESVTAIVIYTLLLGLGAIFVIPGLGMFTPFFCPCESAPIWTGIFIWITALITGTWWVLDIRGENVPPRVLGIIGSTSVALAAIAGGMHLMGQVIRIL